MAKDKKTDEVKTDYPVQVVDPVEAKRPLTLSDMEVAERRRKTTAIAGDMPYSKDLYVTQIRLELERAADALFMAGKMLLVVKENEPHGEFVRILEEVLGIPHASAYRMMSAALKAEAHPKIDFTNFDKKSKIYTLLEAPDEDLKELEEKGVMAGATLDEWLGMSVKEMRAKIHKLKHDVDKIVKEETKGLKIEVDSLVKQVEKLRAFDPDGKDINWSKEQISVIEKQFIELQLSIRKLVIDPRLKDNLPAQAAVAQKIYGMERMIKFLIRDWIDTVEPEGK
ncbi:MAG: hypothetical protein HQK98_06885 [Nitrospirae bacterium]|nr:hypothetical protein [Nitrospirota bacterium]